MTDLITLEEYKEAQGITSLKEDLRLENLIPSVSQLIKTYCGSCILDYYDTNKTEIVNIDYSTHIIHLTEWPVNTIVSVEERSSYQSEYVELTEAAHEFYFDQATDSIFRTTGGLNYKNWPRGPGAVKIVYTAGYAETPADLRLAVIDLITYYLKDEHKERRTLSGASMQNQGTTSQINSASFPDHIKRVLDLYKNF